MSKLILVTGVSGFVASHIVYQLLEAGHRVRATARSKKVDALKALYSSYPSLEIVEVADVASSQFGEALTGVDAVIHTASPLAYQVDTETLIRTAVEGTMNVLRQAEKAGVKKFVVTSSIAAVLGDPAIQGVSYKSEHWNPITKETFVPSPETDPFVAYLASKTLSERAVWEWAEAHPHVDVTTLCPTMVYGPFAPLYLPIAPGDQSGLSTNSVIYKLFTPPGAHLPTIGFVDVRDTAKAHVGAALSPIVPNAGIKKRAILASPAGLAESKLFDMIREKRPLVGARLVGGDNFVSPYESLDVDFADIERITGLKKSDYHTPEQTFLETIDSLLEVEKHWNEQGSGAATAA